MERFNIPEDVPIESKMVTRQIKSAQAQIEGQNAEIRKNVLKYDEVLNKQRQVVYAERKRVLDGEDLHEQVRHMIDDVVGAYVQGATAEDPATPLLERLNFDADYMQLHCPGNKMCPDEAAALAAKVARDATASALEGSAEPVAA